MRVSRLKRELADVQARLAALEVGQASAGSPRAERPGPTRGADGCAAAAPTPSAPEPTPSAPVADAPPADRATNRRRAAAGAAARAARAAAASATESTSLEDAIGGRLMLWVGAIVLVLGVAFFLKYAFDNEWITESMRVALGVLAGAASSWPGSDSPARLQRVRADRHRRRPRRPVSGDLRRVQLLRPHRPDDDVRAAGAADGGRRGAGRSPARARPGVDGRRWRLRDAVSRRQRRRRAAHAVHATTRCWSSARSTWPTDRAGPA